ncbi:hypothetical protein AVEN_59546-1 [Araneus ventricosus]|uniref:Uncharacterized protein n=1 Tax=Araneus ventricosus TaxID=182803 RepID=A0A4Y2MQW7_ARAVE|nr:hypothetical protein AVEN_59546-1 [Araneus ventricosus]
MRAQFEVLIFRVISVKYCLISQNGQVVENWRSASRTEIKTPDLVAMEITVDHKDGNHEVQRPSDWPIQVRNKINFVKKNSKTLVHLRRRENIPNNGFSVTGDEDCPLCVVCGEI